MGKKRKRYTHQGAAHSGPVPDPTINPELEKLFSKIFHYKHPRDNKDDSNHDDNTLDNNHDGDHGNNTLDSKYDGDHGNNSSSWQLPGPEEIFQSEDWQIPALQKLKSELNATKSLLSQMDIETWHGHTQFTNKAGQIIHWVRSRAHPELCTQAWCKFYEILVQFDLLSVAEKELCSVHLCEAPGAFITSLNHRIQSTGTRTTWKWLANTLNPYYEGNSLGSMIDDDRFILYTLDRWCFGQDDTGDIMNRNNLDELVCRCKALGNMKLVTADGSIDCQNTPSEQEVVVSHLHYCEVVASLSVLSPGGALVIKMFTMFEASSVCLMYILNCTFAQVSAFKPATSKSGNSEVYIVCRGYRGLDNDLLHALQERIGPVAPETPVFKMSAIPASFIEQHEQCCQFFKQLQSETIMTNLAWFENMEVSTRLWLESIRKQCAEFFLDKYGIHAIQDKDRIVPPWLQYSNAKKRRPDAGFNRRFHQGSYRERQKLNQLPWQQRVQQMTLYDVDDAELYWLSTSGPVSDGEVSSWRIVEGLSVADIQSSRFCPSVLLHTHNDLLSHTQQSTDESLPDQVDCGAGFAVLQQRMAEHYEHSKPVKITQLGKKWKDEMTIQAGDDMERQRTIYWTSEENGDGNCQDWKQVWVSQLLSLVKVSRVGDCFVCCTGPVLSRFSATMIYILHRLFQQVSFLDDGDDEEEGVEEADSSRRILKRTRRRRYFLCWQYAGCPKKLGEYLSEIRTRLLNIKETPRDILQVLPMAKLCEPEFHYFVSKSNQEFLKRGINSILTQEKHAHKSHPQPHPQQQQQQQHQKQPEVQQPKEHELQQSFHSQHHQKQPVDQQPKEHELQQSLQLGLEH